MGHEDGGSHALPEVVERLPPSAAVDPVRVVGAEEDAADARHAFRDLLPRWVLSGRACRVQAGGPWHLTGSHSGDPDEDQRDVLPLRRLSPAGGSGHEWSVPEVEQQLADGGRCPVADLVVFDAVESGRVGL